RQRHFLLLWRRACGWRIRVVREFGIHQVDIGCYGRWPRSEPRLQGFALSNCNLMSHLCRHDPTNPHTPIHMKTGATWHAATEQRGGRLHGPVVGSEPVVE
ncbi:hypothetical protein G3N88_17870, partial [Xanthomonas hortorum pv. gardneri]